MRMSLPRMAEIAEPLRAMLEERMSEAPRQTANLASEGKFPDHSWTDDRVRAWKAAQDLVASAVILYHPRPDLEV